MLACRTAESVAMHRSPMRISDFHRARRDTVDYRRYLRTSDHPRDPLLLLRAVGSRHSLRDMDRPVRIVDGSSVMALTRAGSTLRSHLPVTIQNVGLTPSEGANASGPVCRSSMGPSEERRSSVSAESLARLVFHYRWDFETRSTSETMRGYS